MFGSRRSGDPKRAFSPTERKVKLEGQGGKCANCGNPTDLANSRGLNCPDQHADGGRTVPEGHVEVCVPCTRQLVRCIQAVQGSRSPNQRDRLVQEVETFPNKSEEQQPIPEQWRPVFRSIVSAMILGDFVLESADPRVKGLTEEEATCIEDAIADYGDIHLMQLPDECWDSSVAMWQQGYWQTIVDLWSEEEGRIDLVLETEISESNGDFVFVVYSVYVP
jgi:hypothetical protein